MSSAAKWDICIEQGATWTRILEFLDENNAPVNVSTWTFFGQIRAYVGAPDVLAEFVFTPGASSNKVIVTLSAAVTKAIPTPPSGKSPVRPTGLYIYDINADTGGGVIARIFQGSATVSAEVTDE